MSENAEGITLSQLTLFAGDSPAKTLAWPDAARDWMESGADSGMSLYALLESLSRDGLLLRTSPVFCPLESDGTWAFSSDSWQNAGIWGRTGCLTLSGTEWPSDAAVCSLSAILETGVPQKYYLSARAARGILRRAEKRGKELPPMLREALEAVAEDGGMKELARSENEAGAMDRMDSLPPFKEWIKATENLGGTREEWERLKEMERQS